MSNSELKKRLQLASLIVLIVGLCAASLVHIFAQDVEDASLGYVVADGVVYPLATKDSKIYRREVQRFGGKAALAFDDFGRWFGAQWQGKTLARTIGWISAVLALGIYFFASALGPDADSAPPEGRDDRDPR